MIVLALCGAFILGGMVGLIINNNHNDDQEGGKYAL